MHLAGPLLHAAYECAHKSASRYVCMSVHLCDCVCVLVCLFCSSVCLCVHASVHLWILMSVCPCVCVSGSLFLCICVHSLAGRYQEAGWHTSILGLCERCVNMWMQVHFKDPAVGLVLAPGGLRRQTGSGRKGMG